MFQDRVSTGISGMDELLQGGLVPWSTCLVRGGPGTGKTIAGLHFLVAGVAKGEKTLFITLGEPADRICKNAEVMGFDLKDIAWLDLSPTPEFFTEMETYDIFSPAEVEREPFTQKIMEHIEKHKPQRVFLDDMTQFRYLTTDPYQFRKQVLSFVRYLVRHGATVVFTSESSLQEPDDDLQFMADVVIDLNFNGYERNVRIIKFRGSGFRSGRHAMILGSKGMIVYPGLVPAKHKLEFASRVIASGIPELDELLNGGVEQGTITVISGPSGVGKSTIGLLFMKESAGRGEFSVDYSFDEEVETLLHRCKGINIPAIDMINNGMLSVIKVEPLRLTPDEFVHIVRRDVEEANARIVMIDSISGYRLAFRDPDITRHLYALCKYLANIGVTVFLVDEVENIAGGEFRPTGAGISYMADNIIFLRYLEIEGELRKAIGVLKKRGSDFEKVLRELEITSYGVKVSQPLTKLRRILSGMPTWIESERKGG